MSDRAELLKAGQEFKFDKKTDEEFERLIKRYPEREAMILPGLWLIQDQQGWVSQEAMEYLAEKIGTPVTKVYEVATFYTMYKLHPMGKYHISVCRTLSCHLCGKAAVLERLTSRLGIEPGQVSEDGMFSLEEAECLGHCGTAPVIQVNDDFHENMTPEKVDSLLDELKSKG
jgi:NADH-quinone oxidoreductase E subunit